ncbi:hypothetical protein CAI21_19990 [Alkalilimnicola ehrlichii]|uniref:Type III pantothenate kinase n=1 Tax=Alkalilimnicola ehrlichii TaxID=351052 RepID=A0A3E0WJ45_9GAMM|nr:type III pantothenate kinase [Alkalilimnicola ehrlichii]RFA25172.1 hypothetical protein CAI21_19990 [Alkalilimnicola ehrlichii]RFA32127.1 hypothetical protein CAL65_20575 [Alkalilimnicola ehrlichii]
MRLLFDIGNTRIKWGWSAGAAFVPGGQVQHRDVARWALPIEADVPPSEVLAVSVAGPEVNARLEDAIAQQFGLPTRFITSAAKAGPVVNAYVEPEKLGIDRWAALVGAYSPDFSACVVDCGSALTVDTVTAAGAHLGGLIIPGLAMMRRSLTNDAHQLPVVDDASVALFAADTKTAIGSGTLLGLAAMIDGIVAAVRNRIDGPLKVYLTGGDADTVRPLLGVPVELEPDLVLKGLALLAEE